MKRCLTCFLAVMMLFSSVSAIAQPDATQTAPIATQAPLAEPVVLNLGDRTEEEVYNELIVGATTRMNGAFFTSMWGNNTSDIDVRSLLHGYSMVEWQTAIGAFAIDRSVVSGINAVVQDTGDKVYTISIAPNMTYSDGTPVTAQDYIFSILLNASPVVREIGGQIHQSNCFVGAQAYMDGTSNVFTGVRYLSDSMFTLTIAAEYLPFFYENGLLDYCPYPMHVIAPGCEIADDGQGAYIRNIDQTIVEPIFTADLLRETILNPETGYLSHPSVVSGPYMLDSYDDETGIAEFSINPNYKGDSNGQLPTIGHLVFKPLSRETMIEELNAGTVDLIHKTVEATTIEDGMRLVSENRALMSNYMRVGLSFFSFNCEDEIFSSEAVRHAFAKCFAKDEYITEYTKSYGLPVYGYLGLGQWINQLVTGSITPPVTEPEAGATAEEIAQYDAQLAEWQALSLDNLEKYPLDIAGAKALLIADGWTLNENGEAFVEGTDAVRCKRNAQDALIKLDIRCMLPEGNRSDEIFAQTLTENLAQIGVKLTFAPKPMNQLLQSYYRQADRDCDLFYLATNFMVLFDPTYTYSVNDEDQGTLNKTGYRDEALMSLATEMASTEPGDVLTYCKRWIAFQEYFAEKIPLLPVYSNVYFDFYTPRLNNYQIGSSSTWAKAILYATLREPVATAPEETTTDTGEIEFIG